MVVYTLHWIYNSPKKKLHRFSDENFNVFFILSIVKCFPWIFITSNSDACGTPRTIWDSPKNFYLFTSGSWTKSRSWSHVPGLVPPQEAVAGDQRRVVLSGHPLHHGGIANVHHQGHVERFGVFLPFFIIVMDFGQTEALAIKGYFFNDHYIVLKVLFFFL